MSYVVDDDGNSYPEPHYDVDDICMCPDHASSRIERLSRASRRWEDYVDENGYS